MRYPGIPNVPSSRSPQTPISKAFIEIGGVFMKYPGDVLQLTLAAREFLFPARSLRCPYL